MNIYIKARDFELMDLYGQIPEVGEEATLLERTNVMTGDRQWGFAPASGAAGNMDWSVRCYHGWRGTTCNVSVHALGLRRIEGKFRYKNGTVRIKLSKDLKPDED